MGLPITKSKWSMFRSGMAERYLSESSALSRLWLWWLSRSEQWSRGCPAERAVGMLYQAQRQVPSLNDRPATVACPPFVPH